VQLPIVLRGVRVSTIQTIAAELQKPWKDPAAVWVDTKVPCLVFLTGLVGVLIFAPFSAGLRPWLFFIATMTQCVAVVWAMCRSTAPAYVCLAVSLLLFAIRSPTSGIAAILGIAGLYLCGMRLTLQLLRSKWRAPADA
jgi:hypothetical protein